MMGKGKQNMSLLGIVLWIFAFTLFINLPEYFEDYLIFFVLILVMITLALIKINR